MRALLFDAHDDERIWEFPYQYLLGDALLVAPVCVEGARTWTTYLPEGEWVDAWSGERLPGRTVVERAVPLDEIPLFITAARAEELLPLVRPGELVEVS
jgi:alpha-glucosidase (family GH31 glycosyl hydrolase)